MNFMGCVRGLRMLHIREVSTDFGQNATAF